MKATTIHGAVPGVGLTLEQREILSAVVATLSSPRDRYRRPEPPIEVRDKVRQLLLTQSNKPVTGGGLDTVDQCLMLLQGMLGVPVQSVEDIRR